MEEICITITSLRRISKQNGEETIIDRNAKGLTLSLGLNKSEAFDKALE